MAIALPTGLRHFMANNHWLQFVGPVVGIIILASAILYTQTHEVEFHGDESGWISSAYYYTDLLLHFDLSREKWECNDCEAWGSLNMQLGKWIYGIPLKLYSQDTGYEFSAYYDWDANREQNQAEGRIPPPETLLFARSISAVFGVSCCLLVFVIGYVSVNWWTGALAALLLLVNDLFIRIVSRALTDSFYVFFLLVGCLACTFFLQLHRRHLAASVMCGMITGLACSIKVSGLVIGGLLFSTIAICELYVRKVYLIRTLHSIAIFSISAIAVIYLFNPFFWPSPQLVNPKLLSQEIIILSKELSTTKHVPDDLSEQYVQISNLTRVLGPLRLFQRWNKALHETGLGRAADWHGNRLITLHRQLLLDYSAFPEAWIFLGVGLVYYGAAVYRTLRFRELTAQIVPLVYFVINYLIIVMFLLVNFSRYYLPTAVAASLVTATGIYAAVLWVRNWLFKTR